MVECRERERKSSGEFLAIHRCSLLWSSLLRILTSGPTLRTRSSCQLQHPSSARHTRLCIFATMTHLAQTLCFVIPQALFVQGPTREACLDKLRFPSRHTAKVSGSSTMRTMADCAERLVRERAEHQTLLIVLPRCVSLQKLLASTSARVLWKWGGVRRPGCLLSNTDV